MSEIIKRADAGMPLLGICNGFQILCEAHLLPGALTRNAGRTFVCTEQRLRVESIDTVWTNTYTPGPGDHDRPQVRRGQLCRRRGDPAPHRGGENQVVFRYVATPTSARDIAGGVTNERGNVVGLMPHPPEHNVEDLTGNTDGKPFFTSVQAFLARALG